MSSPMVNKDTVYSYSNGYFLCFMHTSPKESFGEGTSIRLNGNNYFEWAGKVPKKMVPVGQRCILQW